MHMIFRTLLHILFLSRRKPDLAMFDVARTRFVTLPTDQDINRHMNNGVYFSIMDVARMDLIVRTGYFATMRERGWYPVVVSETISFRKSLSLWQRFTIESRILGVDDKAFYMEQRFVRRGADGTPEIYAKAFVRGRMLRKAGGTVPIEEVVESMGGLPEGVAVPERVLEWGQAVALPATRADAPSIWE
ncbi:acyl-CoA thioesterase [Agromyces seonyuensis]|uniref:4-hydroxybenzoyl-CoA thioesterase n=1 Tax=Agromyces seonyuensis TaxID=2662446 RepID=A0A6I4NW86_9MICO|nr:acyl-CoA thioesterase [Agromyces seonyuensis]MWB98590.1 4-hydroxybenzoyl-CoA thioesterase [Agromyces seonyuensis]